MCMYLYMYRCVYILYLHANDHHLNPGWYEVGGRGAEGLGGGGYYNGSRSIGITWISQRVEYKDIEMKRLVIQFLFLTKRALQYQVKYMIKRYFVQNNMTRLIDYRIMQT